jgi:TolB-like protein
MGAERFLKEIRVSEQLHHPHIVTVLDSGSYEDQLYFVLPHMEGGTLRTLLQQQTQLTVAQTLAITRSIAGALAHAHSKGLVHRDVKPENILFTSGQACLSDFGIARALEQALSDGTTSTSVIRGTPAYMSPEQAGGSRSYDGRSDIYSLGSVVYEMLSGMQPYVGPTPESVLAQKLTQEPRPLRTYRPTLPRAIEVVIGRALMSLPADRYQNALEFADALETAAQSTDTGESVAVGRKRWMWYAIGATAAIALATILLRPWNRPEREAGIPPGDPRRVAVLYLDDLTPNTVPSHVVDGLTEDLIDQLGAVRALHVTSPNGVRPYRTTTLPLDSVARALSVGTIVSGSVARSGNTLRANVRLIDAKTGRQLYSKSLEAAWSELFTLQDRLADQVAFFLRQQLGDEIALRAHRQAARSLAAWETVQLATQAFRRASDAELRADPATTRLWIASDSIYARAEQMDPGWSLPTVRRGRVALALASQARPPSPTPDSAAYTRLTPAQQRALWVSRSLEFANTALKRSPTAVDALELRGSARFRLISTGQADSDSLGPAIERDMRSVVLSRPDRPAAWSTLASLYRMQGRFAESAAAAEQAFEADAFFEALPTMSIAFFSSLHAERFDEARRWCRLGHDHYGDHPRFAECELTLLGWTGKSRADITSAWNELNRIERADTVGMLAPTRDYRRLMVALILARVGGSLQDSARAMVDRVERQPATNERTRSSAVPIAYARLLLGDRAAALARLAELVRVAPQLRPYVAKHPWFETLHSDPRFQDLIRQPKAVSAPPALAPPRSG